MPKIDASRTEPPFDPMVTRVNPWLIVPKFLIVGSTVRGYINQNVSFLGKVLELNINKVVFDTGEGKINGSYKGSVHELKIGEYYCGKV